MNVSVAAFEALLGAILIISLHLIMACLYERKSVDFGVQNGSFIVKNTTGLFSPSVFFNKM